ncbi:UNVERIFIED_CONTAM: Haloacid dehalogenase-like hydrolase domain-containing protein 2, partial [Siphonaria sp. JEL0065]
MVRIRGVCIDLSGTLHVEDALTPNAVAALNRLYSDPSQLQIRFVSNTTKESAASLVSRLSALGLRIRKTDLFTSLSAAALLVGAEKRNSLLFLGADAKSEFGTGNSDPDFDSVVVGLSPDHFNYESMTRAMNVLLNAKNPAIIAAHKRRYMKTKDGLVMGPGPFVAALEYATGVKARVVGKPEPAFFKLALDDMKLDPSECVHIGDDVRDDVGGALAVGMQGILVKTGKYRLGDESAHGITPSATVSDFSAAVDLILESWV